MNLSWLGLGSKKEKPNYKKGHLGKPNTARYVPGAGWVDEGAPTPDASSTLAPPPKPSTSSPATDATPAAPPTTNVGHPMTMTLANRYVKPAGASKAAGSGVVLPLPGIGRGRGQGGRGGAIKTFVPQAPGSTTVVTPEWMKKKTPTSATSEEASSATVNPFADSSPAVPAESAADESLPTPMEAESAQGDQSADQGTSAKPSPAEEPSAEPTSTPTDTPMESQESTGQSPMDTAFGGSALDAAFGGGNGSSGGGDPLANAFGGGSAGTSGGGPAEDGAFGGGPASTNGGGLEDTFGGGNGGLDAFGGGDIGGLDAFGGGGDNGGLDAFGGGNGGYGLDDFTSSGLDDTFGGALASGAIGQAGPGMPSSESPAAAAGPKFPSRDGSETRTGEDFFGALPGVEGGAVEQGEEASSSGPALPAPSGEEGAPGADPDFDVEAMEERAGVAAAQEYNGFSWQQMMETGQQWRDYGYPEDQVRGFLADYSVDLAVYDYWLWRYYPEWIEWYRNQQTQAGAEASADTTPQEQPGTEHGAAEPVTQHQPQASHSESALEPHLSESATAEQPDESAEQDSFQLSFSLGGDVAAEGQLPYADSASNPEGFGVALGIDAPPMDDLTPVTDAGSVTAESESLAAASMVPEASSTESTHVAEKLDSPQMEAELSEAAESPAADGHVPEVASALAAEDSFTADAHRGGQGLAASTAPQESAFANSGFGEEDKEDLFKESPYFNPMWDSGASPEQPSRSQSPFPGTSLSPSGQAGKNGERSNSQAGGVSRELSFASSSFAPEVTQGQQENGGSQVQHVASLGSWLGQGQASGDYVTRRPSVKLSGPLPWDLLSESSEEELTPRDRQSLVEEEEARRPVQQTTANGRGVFERAPAPDAKGMLAAKTMSIADQLATGLLTAGEHLQARTGLLQQGRGALMKLTESLVPSSSSPPQLYSKSSARLAEIYGHESEGEEGDETPRHHPQSEAEDTSRAHRRLDRGVAISQGGSPHLTPRSTHAAPSDDDEEQEERPQARRKKTGDEPPSRQRSAPEQDDSQGVPSASATAVEGQSGGGANHDQMFADEDEEGWEDMHDLTPAHTAANAAVAEGDDTDGWEEPEDLAAAEANFDASAVEGDDAEGWEEPEDLAPAEATAEATSGAAAAEGVAVAEEAAPSNETEAMAAAAGEAETAVDTHQVAQSEEEEQPGREQDSSPDVEEAEEGWEGSDVLDMPPQASESEQDSLLERLRAVESQLATRDSQVAALAQQLDGRGHMDAELASLRAELADSQQQLSAAQAESSSNAAALDTAQQEVESWRTQHDALQDSSSSELNALRQQLADSESYSDDLAELKEQLNQAELATAELEALRQQLKEFESSSAELEVLRHQLRESESSSAELEALRQQLKESESSSVVLEALRSQLKEPESVSGELESLKQQLEASETASAELESLRQQLQEHESSSGELKALRQQLQESESASAELESLRQQLKDSESVSSELKSVRQRLTEAESSNTKHSESLEEAEQRVADLEAELDELRVGSTAAEDKASQAELHWKAEFTQLHSELEQLRVDLSDCQGKLQTVTQSLSTSETRCSELEAELEEEVSTRSRLESELNLSSQQLSRHGLGDDSTPETSAGKEEAAQQELQDIRAKFSMAETRALELEEQVTDLAAAKAAAEAAVLEHLALREKQTERIRKAKAGGVKGLPLVTAEREEAILRADKAELESTQLQAQLTSLQKKLHDYSSVTSSSHSPAESASSHAHAESASAAQAPDSPPSQPPASSQNGDLDLSARVNELSRQLEAATTSASAAEADLNTARAELASERGMSESIKAALRTELAVLTQGAEADSAALAEQMQELSSQHDTQRQQAETLSAQLADVTCRADSATAERDSLADRSQQLESEKEELTQQLQGLLASARGQEASEEEVRRVHEAHQKLREKVEALEEEAQENFDKFSAKEEECDRVEAQLSALQASHPQELEALEHQLTALRQQQEDATRAQQEAEEQLGELQQQLQHQLLAAGSLTERILKAETSSTQAAEALAAAEARVDDLQQQLTAAEEARDEFVDLLSPKKPPRPPGSPAPKATESQLRAALKAAREHAISLESAATSEMASADEAFVQLGDAETTIRVLKGVLEDNGINPAQVLCDYGIASSEEGDDEEEADDDEKEDDEEEEDEEDSVQAIASAAQQEEAWFPGQDDHQGPSFDSPVSTGGAGLLQTQAPASPTSPSRPPWEEEEEQPPLQASTSSPVLKAIPFMSSSQSPTRMHEISLDAWGVGQGGQQAVEGWEEAEDDWMNQ